MIEVFFLISYSIRKKSSAYTVQEKGLLVSTYNNMFLWRNSIAYTVKNVKINVVFFSPQNIYDRYSSDKYL